ncbi:MAG: hypothetical protein OXE42_01285 [Gammaproteobacteria bacterium]|nr:hypothetical protein [Gammaproteobacteria bacterium]
MAITVLSPWPTTPAALATAISTLKDAIQPGASNAEIERLGAVASARVEQYAPGAPDPIKTEAVILFSGYLLESARAGYGVKRGDSTDLNGHVSVSGDYVTNHGAGFRNCSAAALLSPWKVRRAGAIKTDP